MEKEIVVYRIGNEITNIGELNGRITFNFNTTRHVMGTKEQCKEQLSVPSIGVTDFTKIDEYEIQG